MIGRMILEFLFPPKCVGCRERLDLFESPEKLPVFCDSCRADWERDKLTACPTCRVAANECTCTPATLDKKHIFCISLVKFGRTQCVDRLIYSLKRRRVNRNFDFVASELASRLDSFAKTTELDLTRAVITHVPRKKRSISEYGFDHAQILAKRTAEISPYPYARLLLRGRDGRDQKKLTLNERGKNVKGSFKLKGNEKLDIPVVILVDDVVTSGKTAEECIRTLRSGGVSDVVLLSIARASEKKKAKRRRRASKKSKKD